MISSPKVINKSNKISKHPVLNPNYIIVKKDNNERIQDFDFIYYVITELLDELKYYKLSKHKIGQCIYSKLVFNYHYSEEFIAEYI